MPTFTVTLTQKYKTDIEASNPYDALQQALKQIESEDLGFEPTTHSVKEQEDDAG